MIDSFFWRRLIAHSGLGHLLPFVKRGLVGSEAHLHRFSDRLLATPIDLMADPALLPFATAPDSIDLAMGHPRCDLPMSARGALGQQSTPWGDNKLRHEVVTRFALEHGPEHDPHDEALITQGASGAFSATIDAYLSPGDQVVLFDPTSPLFSVGLKHRRANIAWVPTWADRGTLRFDMARLSRAIRGARMIVLADPASPTGGTLAPEDAEQIAFWARKADAMIYQDLSFDHWRDEPARARLATLPHVKGRLISVGSYSKSHGLVGARVGWVVGDRALLRPIAAMATLNAPFVSAVCQHLALQAEQTAEKTIREQQAEVTHRRQYVREKLEDMGLTPWSSHAGLFFWAPTPNGISGRDLATNLYRDTGVLVAPGEPFGPSGNGFIRVSLSTDEGRLREGLNRMAAWLTNEQQVEDVLPLRKAA